ncbi:SusC/RagA family TonB-linked outer membrane protein [Sphingobacterium faecale]|uniref:SusC/RagA family TonB-linked outer membrane protein n=1 Tax=Sphingobacterium faecale TaxID=2803775 RepID=A0ABS1R8Y9_9SPHI|nr:SusC/RagA family TonB-linked outer membrane protein [Sphingobacterium faecale]MBL1411184.1 SusC/RagA family TonB-linked outer membrane protein [Sphingobacterium faecale]
MSSLYQLSLILRSISVLLVFNISTLFASSYAQTVTLLGGRMTLAQVMLEVERQSGVPYFLNNKDIANLTVDIQVKNLSVKQVMDKLMMTVPISCFVDNETIIIRPDIHRSGERDENKKDKEEKQSSIIKGKVVDARGNPLVGVTISIKGSTISTQTKANGDYIINVGTIHDPILVFSTIGHVSVERKAMGKPLLDVIMYSSVEQIDEVVIGYGVQKRSDLTGSIGSVQMEDLQKAPVKSFDEALAGRVAGVQVTSSEGQPGASIDIVIRGVGSITQNTGPLYVIDGMPVETGGDTGEINPINGIDPADIKSIDILKDASATAIYGARGGNGVVIITTKRGAESAPKVTYNGYFGLQNSTKRQKVLSPFDFVKLQQEIDPLRTMGLYLQGGDVDMEDYKLLDGINWEDKVMRVAPMFNNHLSLSGGNQQTKYSASVSAIDQSGIIINSGFKRIQGRMTLDQQINKKLKVGLDANYSNYSNYGTPTSTSTYSHEINLLFNVWAFRPVSVTNENFLEEGLDPEIDQTNDQRFNPILTAKNELRENYGTTFFVNGYADYNLLSNLKFKVSGTYHRGARRYDAFNGSESRTGHPLSNYQINGSRSFIESNRWYISNQLNYTKTFNKKHYLNAMAAFTAERASSLSFGASAIRLQNENLGLSGLDEGEPNFITSSTSASSMASFMARAIYSYDSRYLLTVTNRLDGSSRFLGEYIYGLFPSVAAAWRLNNESFMKSFVWLSNAKLRSSWGKTGNNSIGNFVAHAALQSLNTTGYGFGNNIIRGVVPTSLGNEALKWEASEQIDLGLDVGFLNDRIAMTIDFYRKKSHDLLMNAELSPSTGYPSAIKNIGKIQNDGLEITLGLVPIKKTFTWTSDFNISFNKNKVLELVDNQTSRLTAMTWGDDWRGVHGYIAKLNKPVSQFYGVLWDGVYTYDDFDFDGINYTLKPTISTNGTANVQPGHIKYKDLNGDRVIDDNDKVVIGNPLPKHFGGWSNNFSYKGFDLNIFLQWSYGNDVMNANRIIMESGYKYNINQFASYKDRWAPDNQDGKLPVARGALYKTYSDRVVEDGSFIRLKTAAFGYNIPLDYLKKIKLAQLRLYVSAQNLYTWTNYSGYDPEVSIRNSALTAGFDYSAYPRARTYTFGLNMTF